MISGPIVPCLWFDDEAEQAAAFYTKTFPGGRVTAVSHYPESSDKPRGGVLTVDFEVAGQRFTALNGGPLFVKNPSISFFVFADSAGETDRLFAALADGGEAMMPLASYPWSERYGWVKDRFGVSWQVMLARRAGSEAAIVPCLMFTGRARGRADEAMQTYARIFPGGRIDSVARYASGEGPAGWVKHARFTLAGQEMIAMDSHVDNGFTFNEGISLEVMCKDQGEIDSYWSALTGDGGQEGPCGWIKDRFGLSWQVVPANMSAWMTSKDAAARDRAFAAVMRMKKLDIAVIESAFEGRAHLI
jgi:predicted 3-demethylubiquinone-9 3-methyltransferase (glyoxalase superfamily)